jgi:hypothetical protein
MPITSDVAYLTCPDCMMPNPVADDAVHYSCFSCFSRVVFETCPECGFQQAIPARWQNAFTCGKCEERVPIPRTRLYSTSTKAMAVKGYGYVYPKF